MSDPCIQMFRSRKAHAIAALLRGMGATAADAATLPPHARQIAAQIAGWSSVSDETWGGPVCSTLCSGSPRLGASA